MKKIFIILSLSLLTYNIAFSQTGFRIKSYANLTPHQGNGRFSALWGWTSPAGSEYAILGCFTGTTFVDITDTANIHEVGFLPSVDSIHSANGWREMKTYSHYCYIVSEVDNSNIQIVDLQYLPDSIRYVGKFNLPDHSSTHSISQAGQFLYLNGCNPSFTRGIAVVDLSVNPEIPILRGKWQNLYVHDSRIVNDTIWACNIIESKVTVINAIDKNNLTTITSWLNLPPPVAPHNIALTNNRKYAFVTDEAAVPYAGRMKIWNVSDLGNIYYVKSYNPAPFENSIVHNVEIYNDFAFIAYYTAGIKVLNISNPEAPVELGWYDTYPKNNSIQPYGCWGVYYFPASGKIIASDRQNGLFVLKPNLNNQVTEFPRTNFTVSDPEIFKTDSLTILDMTEGLPVNWQWTVTGTANKTSVLKNPKFAFNTVGEYNVKLKSGNITGNDSVYKTNIFKVKSIPFQPYQIINPINNPYYYIYTSPSDTGKILFNWTKSNRDPDLTYKINFRFLPSTTNINISTQNNGRDTFNLITKSFLDSLIIQYGNNPDSLILSYRPKAFNETDSLFSTNSSLIILKRNTVGIHTISASIPNKFNLYNNYPNPFNPVTVINFDLPVYSNVRIKIFDITGREIKTLLNEFKSAGYYSIDFNSENLSSGVYFYRIEAGSFIATKKMMILK